jgi:hypothetical protein
LVLLKNGEYQNQALNKEKHFEWLESYYGETQQIREDKYHSMIRNKSIQKLKLLNNISTDKNWHKLKNQGKL